MYTYTWYQWLAFFYIYCFFGWIFESVYVSVRSRRFVNRGFLRLPLLPLYGTGAVMMLWVSLPFQNSLILVYLAGVGAATVLEYITGAVMERLFKIKYWDYSSQRFQLHGYICLSSSIAWGFLTILLTEVIHQPVSWLVEEMNPAVQCTILAVISLAFLTDSVQSVKAAVDLGRVLEAMTEMKADLEEMQVQMALLKAEASQKAAELKETAIEAIDSLDLNRNEISDLAEIKALLSERKTRREDRLTALRQKILAVSENRRSLTDRLTKYKERIILDNPTVSSRHFGEALRELKEGLEQRRSSGK